MPKTIPVPKRTPPAPRQRALTPSCLSTNKDKATVRLGGFTVKRRRQALENSGEGLPPAVREPPERSAAVYIVERMHNVPAVRAFLNAPAHRERLHAEKRGLVQHVRMRVPLSRHGAILPRIRGTLGDAPGHRYSVENVLARLAAVKDSPRGFERLCAYEHFDEDEPGPFWQLRILLILMLVIEDCGCASILAERSMDDAKCAICLDSLADMEEMSRWLQLEPCRHWLCASCGDEQARRRGVKKCPVCRCEVVCDAYAVAVS